MSHLLFVFFLARHPPKFDPMPSPHHAFCAKFYQRKCEAPKSEMTKNGKSRRMIDNTEIQYKKKVAALEVFPNLRENQMNFKSCWTRGQPSIWLPRKNS